MKALLVALMLQSSTAWAGDFNNANQPPSPSVGADQNIQINAGKPQTSTKANKQINSGSSQRQTEKTGFGAALKKSAKASSSSKARADGQGQLPPPTIPIPPEASRRKDFRR